MSTSKTPNNSLNMKSYNKSFAKERRKKALQNDENKLKIDFKLEKFLQLKQTENDINKI